MKNSWNLRPKLTKTMTITILNSLRRIQEVIRCQTPLPPYFLKTHSSELFHIQLWISQKLIQYLNKLQTIINKKKHFKCLSPNTNLILTTHCKSVSNISSLCQIFEYGFHTKNPLENKIMIILWHYPKTKPNILIL